MAETKLFTNQVFLNISKSNLFSMAMLLHRFTQNVMASLCTGEKINI